VRISAVFEKEFRDLVSSKRLIVILVTFVLSYVIAIGSYVVMFSEVGAPMPKNIVGMVLGSLVGYLSLVASVIGIALGFDAVSGEHERGTLRMVLAQPIFRDEFIVGKFLAAVAAISLAVSVATAASVSSAVVMLGITLSEQDVVKVALVVALSILLALAYYSLSVLCSTVFKKSSTSALISIALLIVFFVVLPVLSTVVARAVVGPPPKIRFRPGMVKQDLAKLREYRAKFSSVREAVLSLSLNHHFNRLAGFIAGYRQAAPVDMMLADALARNATSLVVLAVVTLVALAASFMIFTRSELK